MRLVPMEDRVIIEPVVQNDKTPGGIYIPPTAKEKPQIGKVLAVGKGKRGENGKIIPLNLKKGDMVFYPKYGGSEVEADGGILLIIREGEILAKIN